MTFNKSQGQSIKQRLGIYLPRPIFAHGQLYVALSRASCSDNVRVVVDEVPGHQGRITTQAGADIGAFTPNIVDASLLRRAPPRADATTEAVAATPPPVFVTDACPTPSATLGLQVDSYPDGPDDEDLDSDPFPYATAVDAHVSTATATTTELAELLPSLSAPAVYDTLVAHAQAELDVVTDATSFTRACLVADTSRGEITSHPDEDASRLLAKFKHRLRPDYEKR